MTSIRQVFPHYTIEDYQSWEGRWEIIRGIAYAMSPMPSPRHQALAGRIHRFFEEAIEKSDYRHCSVYQPIDYLISEDTIVNPDILIVCKPIEGHYLNLSPDLVVEILSPSTSLKDRNTKYDLYQLQRVPYYIIVDPDEDLIEIYILNDRGKYELMTDGPIIINNCAIYVDWTRLFLQYTNTSP